MTKTTSTITTSTTNKGKPKPYQQTRISAKTARSLGYLEFHGLADFSDCNLFVVPNRYPKEVTERINGVKVKTIKNVSHTHPGPIVAV